MAISLPISFPEKGDKNKFFNFLVSRIDFVGHGLISLSVEQMDSSSSGNSSRERERVSENEKGRESVLGFSLPLSPVPTSGPVSLSPFSRPQNPDGEKKTISVTIL